MLDIKQPLIDFNAIRSFLVLVVCQYEKSAPTVSAWADDLYIRLGENIKEIRVIELIQAQSLLEGDTWEHPHYAANKVYKLMNELGQDTTGHLGY